jgi:DNA-binding response OmpR family regulator
MSQILIIEDERVIRTAVRRLLERRGYQVAEAGSVEEAEAEHDLSSFKLTCACPVCRARRSFKRPSPYRC